MFLSFHLSIMERERNLRTSQRSKTSSTSSQTPKERLIDCCRKLIQFMCTQVGVGGLVVGYTFIGAFTFQTIEQQHKEEFTLQNKLNLTRQRFVKEIWTIIVRENSFNKSSFVLELDKVFYDYQNEFVRFVKQGYNGKSVEDMWNIPAALMFCLSIITMIGYGNLVPRTRLGKALTILYAVFGIPLYILYFMNMGEVLAGTFRWIYTSIYECTRESQSQPNKRIVVPSSASIWVILLYIATGAILFAEWEKWSYLDSIYFCVTSLCKIGFGDFVPGAEINDFLYGSKMKLVVNFVYMLVGLGLVAMCYNLMREEVKVKLCEVKEDLRECGEDVRWWMEGCGRKCGVVL